MVEVYDMNVGQNIRTCADVHSRPLNCIQQNKVTALDCANNDCMSHASL